MVFIFLYHKMHLLTKTKIEFFSLNHIDYYLPICSLELILCFVAVGKVDIVGRLNDVHGISIKKP